MYRKAGVMSGAMRKIGVYLGLLEDTDRYDDEYDERVRRADERQRRAPSPRSRPARPRWRHLRAPSPAAPQPPPRPAPQRRRRAVPDHHAAPAHLQRGAHHR